MIKQISQDHLNRSLGLAGYYIALRVSFAFPTSEINQWPKEWMKHYGDRALMPSDPLIRWAYTHEGVTRWSNLKMPDPEDVLGQAASFGLRYGIVISIRANGSPSRSFGIFARKDREFFNEELEFLHTYLQQMHDESMPPEDLTKGELDALRLVQKGFRLKQVGHELGVSEGAIKQRLKNARRKLGATTGTQAAAIAVKLGLI
jgi:LuxR family transcriptional regulator, quorum-sensing system regulator SdiA